MAQPGRKKLSVNQLALDLATFAIDRTDLKELLQAIPKETALNLTTMEYELQLLKILSTGWAIAFYMPDTDENKTRLTEHFWLNIREVSEKISELTLTTTGQSINYFEILKQRLDTYVKAMQQCPSNTTEPTSVMGPAFADVCDSHDDAVAILIGTKMFTLTLGAVKEYLNSVDINNDIKLN